MATTNLTIIGVGLLGGSIGLGLRAAGEAYRITGYGHRRETLQRAQEFGAIDRYTLDLADATAAADLVILCTPISLFEPLITKLVPLLRPGTLVTDVGSTKRTVVDLAAKLLPVAVSFVGSHPMAGSEKRGVEYARADLFTNALCIVTPTAGTPPEATRAVDRFWKTLGMRTIRLSPEEHDAAVADVSHLPHILAAALVAMQADSALPLAGKGFLDTTRIASGDAQLWRDILVDNKDNLTASLSRLEKQLAIFRKLLTPAKSEALIAWLSQAAARRDQVMQQRLLDASAE